MAMPFYGAFHNHTIIGGSLGNNYDTVILYISIFKNTKLIYKMHDW